MKGHSIRRNRYGKINFTYLSINDLTNKRVGLGIDKFFFARYNVLFDKELPNNKIDDQG